MYINEVYNFEKIAIFSPRAILTHLAYISGKKWSSETIKECMNLIPSFYHCLPTICESTKYVWKIKAQEKKESSALKI